MKLPRALSHSSIQMFLECPQKWKLKYVDGLPEKPRHFFSFGQSVHKALEYFYGVQALPAPPLGDLLKQFQKGWVSEGYKDAAQEQEYLAEGRRILTEFHAKHAPGFQLPYFVEYGFQFSVDGVPVTGKVDRIDKLHDGSLSILDYKTGKPIAPDRVLEDPQLTMYQMACEELLGAKVSKLTFYHLPSLTALEVVRHPAEQVHALRTRIVGVAKAIESDEFAPAPEERKCNWCDFKPHCPVFKHMYLTRHEDETPVEELDDEIAALVARLGAVRDQIREHQATAADLEEQIAEDMERRETARATGGSYAVELAKEAVWDFTDKEEVKRLLRSFGLYEKIQIASAAQLQKLLRDPGLPADLLEQLAKIGKKRSVRTIKLDKLEPK